MKFFMCSRSFAVIRVSDKATDCHCLVHCIVSFMTQLIGGSWGIRLRVKGAV